MKPPPSEEANLTVAPPCYPPDLPLPITWHLVTSPTAGPILTSHDTLPNALPNRNLTQVLVLRLRLLRRSVVDGEREGGGRGCDPESLPPKALHCLVLLCHAHSRECDLAPELRGPAGRGALVWECSAGHSFSWEPPLSSEPAGRAPKQGQRRGQEPAGLEPEHDEGTPEAGPPRGAGSPLEPVPPPGEEEDENEEEMLSDASPWTYSSSPDEQVGEPDVPRPPTPPATCTPEEGETPAVPTPAADPCPSASPLGPGPMTAEAEVQLELRENPQAEPLASPGSQALAQDEDAAQIGPKRIRRAAKRELMPCDFPGCGRIFSNRQYLNIGEPVPPRAARGTGNIAGSCPAAGLSSPGGPVLPRVWRGEARASMASQLGRGAAGAGLEGDRCRLSSEKHHQKYQHIHQKSFCCPEPACGKSFNFKKHLKEHVKLHSDARDYICEFCARSFRTSSNLVIHRRIHTGEKPLQCEICGFTCRQKASLNWHRRKHAETAAALRFPCEFCGKRFEKPDSVAAPRTKSHPAPAPAPQESPGPAPPCAASASEAPGSSPPSKTVAPLPEHRVRPRESQARGAPGPGAGSQAGARLALESGSASAS
ncbi:Zinc finger protein 692 [Heterocephalus glaber]|uniref:Zinc finger protein 692 n=1 Tax=Heterocephalus glaber TaxID=10181 RepID=G5C3K9_HETGA|nr:Zinc finger protein 692 [Heterocephalus glaber]